MGLHSPCPLPGDSVGGQGSCPTGWSGGGVFNCFERWSAVRWYWGSGQVGIGVVVSGQVGIGLAAVMLAFLRWTFWWWASSRSQAGCFLGFCTAGIDSALQQLSSFQNVSVSPAFLSFWSRWGGLPCCCSQDFGRSGLSGVCSAHHPSTRALLLLSFPGTACVVVVKWPLSGRGARCLVGAQVEQGH